MIKYVPGVYDSFRYLYGRILRMYQASKDTHCSSEISVASWTSWSGRTKHRHALVKRHSASTSTSTPSPSQSHSHIYLKKYRRGSHLRSHATTAHHASQSPIHTCNLYTYPHAHHTIPTPDACCTTLLQQAAPALQDISNPSSTIAQKQ